MLDSIKVKMGLKEEDEPPICGEMSYENRMYGFAGCFVTGWLISALATISLWSGNFKAFAIQYTLGNVVVLSSSLFLMGPAQQCKRMWKGSRVFSTVLFLTMIVVTLVVAFLPTYTDLEPGQVTPLVIICAVLQCCASVWYSASYIPYGQRILKSCCKKLCCSGVEDEA